MSQITLEVADTKLHLFMSLLQSLDYVNILSDESNAIKPSIEVEGTSFTEADYLYGFGIMKDKANFTLQNIRSKS